MSYIKELSNAGQNLPAQIPCTYFMSWFEILDHDTTVKIWPWSLTQLIWDCRRAGPSEWCTQQRDGHGLTLG